MKIAGIQFSCFEDKDMNTENAYKMMSVAIEQSLLLKLSKGTRWINMR